MEVLGWIAMFLSWTALYFCGRHRWGWLMNASLAILWIPYCLHLGSLPLILNTVVISVVALRNYFVWSDDDKRVQDPRPETNGQDNLRGEPAN